MNQRPQADIRAAILSRVKRGETIERAAAAECYSNSAVWHWAAVDPGFRAELIHAKRIGAPTTRRKAVFLAALADGRTVREAVALTGVTERVPWRWRQTDPDFAAAYDRLRGAHKHPAEARRFNALIRRIAGGEDVGAALDALGYHRSTLPYWRRRMCARWQAIQRAAALGRIIGEGKAV